MLREEKLERLLTAWMEYFNRMDDGVPLAKQPDLLRSIEALHEKTEDTLGDYEEPDNWDHHDLAKGMERWNELKNSIIE